MPQVPTYGGTQVRTNALQPVMQREIDVSSGTRALGQAVGGLGDMADKMVRRDAETEANRVDSEITGGWLQWDAENRRNFQGQKAGEYEIAAKEWWDKAAETYGKNLSPLAQQAIGPQLMRKRNQAMGSVLGHVNTEKERFADQSYDAAQKTDAQYAVTTGDTAGMVGTIKTRAREYANRKGLDTAGYEAEVQQRLGTMHLTMIESLAESNVAKATEYYNEAKKRNEIPATAQPRVEKVLKAEGDNQFAKTEAVRIYALPADQRAAALAKITDPDRLSKTRTEFNNIAAVEKQAREQEQDSARDEVYQRYEQRKPIPETLLSRMGGPERSAFENMRRDRAKQAASGTPVKTDFATWFELSNRIAAGEKIDLRPYSTKISEGDLQALTGKQQAAGTPGKQDALFTTAQRVDKVLPGLGIDPKKDPESAYKISTEVDRRIRVMSTAKGGKDLLPDEVQKIVDDVALDKVYVEEWGTDPEKPIALLAPGEMDKAYVNVGGKSVKVSSVPSQDRQQIIAALRANGRPATEQAIVELYLRGQQKPAPASTPSAAPAAPRASTSRPETPPLTLGAPVRPADSQPSIYASESEWAAYRASQR